MAGRVLFVILMYSFHTIQTQAHLPPELTVNPPVITETETVTLNCQTPSTVHVHDCYFYTVGQRHPKGVTCLQTLTGTELLRMSHQSSPAEVKVKCFYTVKFGEINAPSPHSGTSSITIQSQKPQLSLHHSEGDPVIFTCSLPGSANKDTKCNLYFGEASHPFRRRTVWKKRTSTNQLFCQFTVTIDDLLRHLHFLQRSDASCDYSLGGEPNSLSPRSDGSSVKDIVKKELSMASTKSAFNMNKDFTDSRSSASPLVISWKPASDIVEPSMTQTKPASTMTTGQTLLKPNTSSLPVTPLKPASGETETKTWTWDVLIVVACLGGVFLLGLVLLCTKRRLEKKSNRRSQANVTDDLLCMRNLDDGGSSPADCVGVYSMITSVAAADCPTGSEKLKQQEPQNEDSAIYHVYATISEGPPSSALEDMAYSSLQAH